MDLPGVGDRLPVLWTFGIGQGYLTPNRFVELTSTNPAKIFGLYPKEKVQYCPVQMRILLFGIQKKKWYMGNNILSSVRITISTKVGN